MNVRLASLMLLWGAPILGFSALPPLDSLAAVRALSPVKAGRGLPVRLDATVTFPDQDGIFIHDGAEGIFLRLNKQELGVMQPRPGMRLQVDGETTAGGFLPDLNCVSYEILPNGDLPPPQRVTQENLFSPGLDCQWVEVPAVIIGTEGQVGSHFALVVEVFGWTLKILVPFEPDIVERVSELMQQRVKFHAVAATVYNDQRQMTGRYFLMPSLEFIKPIDSQATASRIDAVSLDELLRSDQSPLSRVHVEGVVTGVREGELYLRGEGGSLRIIAVDSADFAPGDRVQAEGFAAIAPFRPVLRARKVVKLGSESLPAPLEVKPELAVLKSVPAELVSTEAEVLGIREEPHQRVLQCGAGGQFFEAVVPLGASLPEVLTPGARVRLVGNCELLTSHPLPRTEWVDGFRLHLRGAEDLAVIRPAPWWTLNRILLGTGLLSLLVITFLLWNVALRRRVQKQTKIIGSVIQREAVLHERHRIARDLHDTLEQEMTGVAIQLRNARQSLKATPARAGEALDLAERMIRHCRAEARTSIRDLRSVALEQGGLERAIRDLLAPLAAEAGVGFALEVLGASRRVDFHLENDLLRIAQEATVNALHHAAPTKIAITLEYLPDAFRLTIQDDGCGFDSEGTPSRGHFGLLGMYERANQRHGSLLIESGEGRGTRVKLEVPFAAGTDPLPKEAGS